MAHSPGKMTLHCRAQSTAMVVEVHCANVQVGVDPDNVKEVDVSLDDANLNDVDLDSVGLGGLAPTGAAEWLVHTSSFVGKGKRVSVAHKARTGT